MGLISQLRGHAQVFSPRSLGRGSVEHGSTLLVGLCVLALILSWLARLATPFHPSADSAILEVNIDDAVRGRLLVGPYSRFGWSHPGPLFFYALAPLYYVAGRNPIAIHLGMALLNGASVLATVFVVRRRVGESGARWGAWIAVLFLVGLSPHGLSQFWNPNALAAPLLLFLTLCAAAIDGGSSNLIAATLVGSFLVQTHVGTMGVVGVLLVVSGIGRSFVARSRGAPPPSMRTFLLAVIVGFIAWLPPLVEAATQEGGNLLELGRFFFGGEESARQNNLRLSLIALVRQAGAVPLGVETFPLESNEFSEGRALIVAFATALAACTTWICYTRRSWFGTALAGISLLGCVLGVVSIMHARGPLLSYMFWCCAALPVPAWVAWGLTAQDEAQIRPDTSPSAARLGFGLAALATVGWFSWSAFHTPLSLYLHSQDAPRVADYILEQFPSIRREPIELISQDSSYANYAAIYAVLRRLGVDAMVPPTWAGNFGSLHLSSRKHGCPRYAVYLLDVGKSWSPKPDDLPEASPAIVGQVQVWVLDRNTSSVCQRMHVEGQCVRRCS